MKISWQWNNKRKNKNKNKTKYPNRSARVNVSNVNCEYDETSLFFFILSSILHTVDPLVRIVVQVRVERVDLCKDCLNLYSLTFIGVPLASCVISCFLPGVR